LHCQAQRDFSRKKDLKSHRHEKTHDPYEFQMLTKNPHHGRFSDPGGPGTKSPAHKRHGRKSAVWSIDGHSHRIEPPVMEFIDTDSTGRPSNKGMIQEPTEGLAESTKTGKAVKSDYESSALDVSAQGLTESRDGSSAEKDDHDMAPQGLTESQDIKRSKEGTLNSQLRTSHDVPPGGLTENQDKTRNQLLEEAKAEKVAAARAAQKVHLLKTRATEALRSAHVIKNLRQDTDAAMKSTKNMNRKSQKLEVRAAEHSAAVVEGIHDETAKLVYDAKIANAVAQSNYQNAGRIENEMVSSTSKKISDLEQTPEGKVPLQSSKVPKSKNQTVEKDIGRIANHAVSKITESAKLDQDLAKNIDQNTDIEKTVKHAETNEANGEQAISKDVDRTVNDIVSKAFGTADVKRQNFFKDPTTLHCGSHQMEIDEIVISPADSRVAFIVGAGRLHWITENAGVTFTSIYTDYRIGGVRFHASEPRHLLAVTENARAVLLYSRNLGKTWVPIGEHIRSSWPGG